VPPKMAGREAEVSSPLVDNGEEFQLRKNQGAGNPSTGPYLLASEPKAQVGGFACSRFVCSLV
jgi:hypothetical protein